MDCEHSDSCAYVWDMRGNQRMMDLYHAHESIDEGRPVRIADLTDLELT